MAENRGGRIVLIPLPPRMTEKARDHDHEDHEDQGHGAEFVMDPSIPIPAEIPQDKESLSPDELTMEMILSGMLALIASDHGSDSDAAVKPEWIDYYRGFVKAARPGIFVEFTEAAILKAKNRDFDGALEILGALGGLFPGSPVVLLNQALVLEERADMLEAGGKQGDAEDAARAAEAAYDRALALDPPFPNALFNAGYFRLKRRDFAGAEVCFGEYLSLAEQGDPGTEDEKAENAEKAVREIRERFLADENLREAWELVRGEKEEEALGRIRGFLENHPEVWNGWFTLGWALRRLGRWDAGAEALRKAVELGGTHTDVRNELAICLMELADYSGARKELENALVNEPENIKIISNLGVLAMKRGDNEEAAAFFRTALDLEPDDPVAGECLRKLQGTV